MLSSDRRRSRGGLRAFGLLPLVALVAAALTACTVQPLYAPTAAGTSVVASIGSIYIEDADTRLAQEVRNKLIFNLNGGAGQPDNPAYRMRLIVTAAETALGVTTFETAPAYSITVAATYEITLAATGKIVLRSTARSTASFDRVNQVYANTRARLDAENRAAALVADEIRIRLSAAAAKGTI